MNRSVAKWASALSGLALTTLLMVPEASAHVRPAASVKTGGTLVTEMQWGTIADNFNPFLPAGSNAGGTMGSLYLPLFYNNLVTGQTEPLLGVSYKWVNNLTLEVQTRSGVEWSDGQPFSAADVAFTFNYIKKYPALDLTGIWNGALKSVTATGPNTVVFRFSKPDTPLLYYIEGQVIVPQHIWDKITNPTTYANLHPVGSGPFVLKSYTPYSVTYVRNPHFWMKGRPYINELVMEADKSNNTTLLDLLNGTVDFSSVYVTDVPRLFVARDPAVNHYWWPSTGINALYLNTQEYPFNNPLVRKAIAYALNTKLITQRTYFGAVGDANPTGLVSGQIKQWFDPSLKSLEYRYDPAEARKLLKEAGFKWNSSGQLETANGSVLPTYNILVGAGWTDYISMAQIISQELQAIGLSTTVQQEPWDTYESSVLSGRYDMVISWGSGGGSTPYYLYYQEFYPTFSAKQIGQTAVSDWSRFTSPVITQALNSYAATSNLAVQKQDIATIERQVLENVPFIPLNGRPNGFLVYQTRQFVGWPSPSDPYNMADPPDQVGAFFLYINIHLK
jgi:peptide/nickel transport system substrate-binding protein